MEVQKEIRVTLLQYMKSMKISYMKRKKCQFMNRTYISYITGNYAIYHNKMTVQAKTVEQIQYQSLRGKQMQIVEKRIRMELPEVKLKTKENMLL